MSGSLSFIDELFTGKTGSPYSPEELTALATEGEERYKHEVPPGYKDANKQDKDDPYRKFGDFLIWKQTIRHAKANQKPVILITDDKKEDWWLEQSGRTVGPRPELIEEFKKETNQGFWMYTVDRFVQESAKTTDTTVSEEVLTEIVNISENLSKEESSNNTEENNLPSIIISQEIFESSKEKILGIITITLNRDMHYATGTGKFKPNFENIPQLEVNLIDSPLGSTPNIGISYGCGKVSDFNIHLKPRTGKLTAGNYVFSYAAIDTNIDMT
ncbi:PIN-like domain-containing protein [Geopseudomonas aromaticivorans]